MTPHEQSMIKDVFRRVAESEPAVTDPEAAALVRDAMRGRPDLPYVLAYQVVLLGKLLEGLEAESDFLRRELLAVMRARVVDADQPS
jgi:hypothetical protein